MIRLIFLRAFRLCHFSGGKAFGNAGVITVEFAVVLPFLLFLFFGSLELARIHVTSSLVERVMMETALKMRFSMGRASLDTIFSEAVAEKLSPMASLEDLTVIAESAASLPMLLSSPVPTAGEPGDVVRLEIKANLGFLDWLLPEAFTAERSFMIFYVNEAESYEPLD